MKTKNNKMIATAIAIILLVIAIIISLVFVFNNRHSAKDYNNKLDEAQKYVAKLDYKKAEATYLKAIDINPKQPTAYVELADVYVTVNKQDKAEDILEKGYKNVEGKENKKIIKDKQEEIKDGMNVINNGGDYVTYKGKSYYWEYHGNSFRHPDTRDVDEGNLLNYDNAVNDLICADENGNKKTIFSGHSYGDIWIFNNRIFIEKVDDGDCCPVYSMKLDGTDLKEMDDYDYIRGICDKGLIFTDRYFSGKLMTSDLKKKLLFEGDFICADGNVIYFTSLNSNSTMLKSIDTDGENETTLAQISDQEDVTFLQVIDNDIYFQYGDFYSSKIAKVKKDGTGFTDLEDNSTNKFTAYKEKDGKVTFKHGSALNEPFEEDGSVYAYTGKSSKRVKMLSPDEYKDLGKDLQNISYSGDNLYYVVIKWDGDTIYGYSYCKKDLNNNKITVYYNIDVDWA